MNVQHSTTGDWRARLSINVRQRGAAEKQLRKHSKERERAIPVHASIKLRMFDDVTKGRGYVLAGCNTVAEATSMIGVGLFCDAFQ